MKDVSTGASSDLRSILLFVACAAFLLFFWTSPAAAQNGDEGNDDDDNSAVNEQYPDIDASNDACPNPNVVLETGSQTQSNVFSFETVGRTFRVNYTVEFADATNENFLNSFEIDFVDDLGPLSVSGIIEESENGSFIVTEGANEYELVADVSPGSDATYTITVADCLDRTTQETTQTTDDPQSGVVAGTFPDKPLANTGMGTAEVSGSFSGAMVLAALIGAAALSGGFGAAMIRLGKRRG